MKTSVLGNSTSLGSVNQFSLVPLVASAWTWNQQSLSSFKCLETDSWQLPQECGSNCQDTDKTFDR